MDMNLYRVSFNFLEDTDGNVDEDFNWDTDRKTVVAKDGESAIHFVKKATLSTVTKWTDEDGKKHVSKIVKFELTGLEMVSSVDIPS